MEETDNIALLEIKNKLGERQARAKLAAALAKAQGEFKPIEKNQTVTIKPREKPSYTFSYADLEQLISCTRPALAANGLAIIQQLHDGKLVTQLLHAEGGVISSEVGVPRVDGEPKSYGALLTYLRRYAYSALLCLAADDDLDEDGQGVDDRKPVDSNRDRSPHREEPKPRAKPVGEKRLANSAQLKWAKEKLGVMDADTALELLARHGIKSLDSELTVEAFETLKKDLLA